MSRTLALVGTLLNGFLFYNLFTTILPIMVTKANYNIISLFVFKPICSLSTIRINKSNRIVKRIIIWRKIIKLFAQRSYLLNFKISILFVFLRFSFNCVFKIISNISGDKSSNFKGVLGLATK